MSNPPSELLRRLLEASANSPLSEADPKSLDELMARIPQLFNTKPLDLAYEDITDITTYYRAKRAMFSQLAKDLADKPRRGRTTNNIPSGEELGI